MDGVIKHMWISFSTSNGWRQQSQKIGVFACKMRSGSRCIDIWLLNLEMAVTGGWDDGMDHNGPDASGFVMCTLDCSPYYLLVRALASVLLIVL